MFRKILLALVLASGLVQAQVPIGNLPPANLPLQPTDKVIVDQVVSGQKTTRQAQVQNLTTLVPPLTANYLLQAGNALLPNSRTLAGTANEILLADGGALGNLVLSTPQAIGTSNTPTFAGMTLSGTLNGTAAIFSSTVNATGAISSSSSVTAGSNVSGVNGVFSNSISAVSAAFTNPLPGTSGGTGFNTYTIGDLLSADSSTTLTKLNDVSVGSYLRSGGAGTLPLWSTVKIPNTDALGDLWVGSSTNNMTALAGNITTAKQFLTQTGTGAVSASPAWGTIAAGDLPGSFSGFANPSGLIGLTAVNGVATTADRSDSAHAIDQSIIPTWTGIHTFSNNVTFTGNGAAPAATTTQVSIRGGSQADVAFINSAAAANNRIWDINVDPTGNLALRAVSDSFAAAALWGTINRTATAITGVTLGNTTDKPAITLNGPVTIPAPTSGVPLTILDPGSGTTTANVGTTAGTANSIIVNSKGAGGTGTFEINSSGVQATEWTFNNSGSTDGFGVTTGNTGIATLTATGSILFNTNAVIRMTIGNAGAITMPGLASSSAATTGTVCWTSGGNLTVDTTVACLASTQKVKQAIDPLDAGLRTVMQLRPVSYDLKPEFDTFHSGRQVGLIAEDVQKVDPRLIALDSEGDPRGVRYMQLTAVLVKAIQQQQYERNALWIALIGSFGFTLYRTRRA